MVKAFGRHTGCNPLLKNILIVSCIFALSSCVLDSNPKILNIANVSDTNISIFISNDSTISDTTLFFGGKYDLNANKLDELNGITKNTFYIIFFNQDSVYGDIKNKKLYGISERNFLSRYKLSLDSLNEKDTLIYKSPSFIDFHHHIKR